MAKLRDEFYWSSPPGDGKKRSYRQAGGQAKPLYCSFCEAEGERIIIQRESWVHNGNMDTGGNEGCCAECGATWMHIYDEWWGTHKRAARFEPTNPYPYRDPEKQG